MIAGAVTDAVRDLWGPGLVFVALCVWLVRRAIRAARNESILEEQRLRDAFDLPSSSTATPTTTPTSSTTSTSTSPSSLRIPEPLFRADVRGASQEHLEVVAKLTAASKNVEVLWVRSNATHVAWAEARPGNREVICVAQVDGTSVVARWQFG